MELPSLVGLRKRGNGIASLVGPRPIVLPDEPGPIEESHF
jgi:hypothetical protein